MVGWLDGDFNSDERERSITQKHFATLKTCPQLIAIVIEDLPQRALDSLRNRFFSIGECIHTQEAASDVIRVC